MSDRGTPVRLVCTDFDGTLVDTSNQLPVERTFFERLEEKRKQYEGSFAWVICTGRDWGSLYDLMLEKKFPLWPNWVVLAEREIWMVRKKRPVGWYEWNRRCELVHDQLFRTVGPLWSRVESFVREQTQAKIVEDHGSPIGIVATSEDEADAIATYLDPVVASAPNLSVVRNQTFFRFSHRNYHKGACMEAIAQGLGIPPEGILAVGDSQNDLSMLDRRRAGNLACPSNAVEEVRSHVQSVGGFVAQQPHLHGVLEAWEHFTATS